MITEKELIQLADSMAAAASQMGQMSYDILINSREQFIEAVHEIYKNLYLNSKI